MATLTFFPLLKQGRLVVIYRSLGALNPAGALSNDRSALLTLESCEVVVFTVAFVAPCRRLYRRRILRCCCYPFFLLH